MEDPDPDMELWYFPTEGLFQAQAEAGKEGSQKGNQEGRDLFGWRQGNI